MKQEFTFEAYPKGTPCWVLERDVMPDGKCPCCGIGRWRDGYRIKEGVVCAISAKINRDGVLMAMNTVEFPHQADRWDCDPDSLIMTLEAAEAALAAKKAEKL